MQTSRLERPKGHALLLQALGRLADLPDWVCWVAGGAHRPDEQEYLAELEKIATDLGITSRVRFLGDRTDVRELLAAADVHCQPNASPDAVGGALEIVDDSCGILLPAGDLAAWTSNLGRLIREPAFRARLGAAGPARARELCDPVQQMTRLSRLLTDSRWSSNSSNQRS